jgi:hypothetical protein
VPGRHQLKKKEKEERENGKNRLQRQKILNKYSKKQTDPENIKSLTDT